MNIRVKRSKHLYGMAVFSLLFMFVGIWALLYSSAEVDCSNNRAQADLNCDNTVNIFDLSLLLSHYSTSDALADINNDGTVNIFDMSILLSRYGRTPTPSPSIGPTGTPGNYAETPIPANIKIDPLSDTVAAELAAQAANTTWVNVDSFAPEIYTVSPSQALVPVKLCRDPPSNCVPSWAAALADQMSRGIPIPKDSNGNYVLGAPGTDKEIVIWQPNYSYAGHTGRLWELWGLENNVDFNPALPVSATNAPLSAWWAGRVVGSKDIYGPGHFFDNYWWDPIANNPGPDNSYQEKFWGSTAAGTWLINDVVRTDDCKAQAMSHSFGLELELSNWQTARWPAQRSDGTDTTKTVGQGMRVFLPADTPVPAGMTRYETMIFNGLKKYGAIVDDTVHSTNGQGSVAVRTQLGSADCKALMDGQAYWQQLDQIPWNKVKLIATGSDEIPNPTN